MRVGVSGHLVSSLASVAFLWPSVALAQTVQPAAAPIPGSVEQTPARSSHWGGIPWFGGFGYASVGIMAGPVTGASPNIERAIGEDGSPGRTGWQLGGGGKALLWGLVIGGKGFYLGYPATSTPAGSATLRGGGGGFDIGYAVVNRARFVLVPFFGIGGIGLDLNLANISAEDVSFGSDRVAAGATRSYSSGFWYLEGGIGGYRFTMPHGGPCVGVELGVMASFSKGDWEDDAGNKLSGVHGPGFVGGYLKVTGGGGGFFLTQ